MSMEGGMLEQVLTARVKHRGQEWSKQALAAFARLGQGGRVFYSFSHHHSSILQAGVGTT